MIQILIEPPSERRNFVHKRLFGAVTGAVGAVFTGGNPLFGAARGFAQGGTPKVNPAALSSKFGGYTNSEVQWYLDRGRVPPPRVSNGQGFTGGGAGEGFKSPLPIQTFSGCPDGSSPPCFNEVIPLPDIDRFVISPAEASVAQTLGQDPFGEAVMGAFGMPALVPQIVGSRTRADGTTGPIRKCPRGTVLATDNLCYNAPGRFRKWKKGTPPFLTGGDVSCLRRAIRLKKSKSNRALLRQLGMG